MFLDKLFESASCCDDCSGRAQKLARATLGESDVSPYNLNYTYTPDGRGGCNIYMTSTDGSLPILVGNTTNCPAGVLPPPPPAIIGTPAPAAPSTMVPPPVMVASPSPISTKVAPAPPAVPPVTGSGSAPSGGSGATVPGAGTLPTEQGGGANLTPVVPALEAGVETKSGSSATRTTAIGGDVSPQSNWWWLLLIAGGVYLYTRKHKHGGAHVS